MGFSCGGTWGEFFYFLFSRQFLNAIILTDFGFCDQGLDGSKWGILCVLPASYQGTVTVPISQFVWRGSTCLLQCIFRRQNLPQKVRECTLECQGNCSVWEVDTPIVVTSAFFKPVACLLPVLHVVVSWIAASPEVITAICFYCRWLDKSDELKCLYLYIYAVLRSTVLNM